MGAPMSGRCQLCGVSGTVKHVSFSQNVGMLVLRQHKTVTGNMCKPCINQKFWSMTGTTLAVGWLGYISLIIAPIMIISNVVCFLGTIGMPAPGAQPKRVAGRPPAIPAGGGRAAYSGPPAVYSPPQVSTAPIPFDDVDDQGEPLEVLEVFDEPQAVLPDPDEVLKPQWPQIVSRLRAKEPLPQVAASYAAQTGLPAADVSAWIVDRVKRAKAKAAANAGV